MLYKDYFLTRVNHQKNTTQVRGRPLLQAARAGHLQVVDLLLRARANTDAVSPWAAFVMHCSLFKYTVFERKRTDDFWGSRGDLRVCEQQSRSPRNESSIL